jgi:uncharacterized protein (TIGR03067 family)
MNKMITCAVALAITAAAAVGAEKNAASDDKAMNGIWSPTSGVLGGVTLPPPALKKITLRIDGDKYEVTVEGEPEPDQGTSTVNTNVTPKTMTVISTNGPNRGKTYPAIYELKDDTLRVCYDLSGKKHPTEFTSVKGTQLYLVTYKRKEK